MPRGGAISDALFRLPHSSPPISDLKPDSDYFTSKPTGRGPDNERKKRHHFFRSLQIPHFSLLSPAEQASKKRHDREEMAENRRAGLTGLPAPPVPAGNQQAIG
jgi:hypothetical protein